MPSITQELMGIGSWSAEVAYNAELARYLVDGAHVLVYRGAKHVYTGVLLRNEPDDALIRIGGPNPEWWLGVAEDGPLIDYAEFVAGTNKLSYGDFAQGFTEWSVAEGSGWYAYDNGSSTGARLDIAPTRDDVLLSKETFAVVAGQTLRAQATFGRVLGVAGMARLRQIFTGRFKHPELLVNGNMESGPGIGWGATANLAIEANSYRGGFYAMRIGPIPKPQFISNHDFESAGADWLGVSGLAFLTGSSEAFSGSGVLRCSPIAYPQYLVNPTFDLGAGYPWTVPAVGDMGIVSTGEARSGAYAMMVGPIRQKQLILNTDLEGPGYWYPSSELATPDATIYYLDPGGGVAASQAVTHAGIAGGPEHVYLRADSDADPSGVDPFEVVQGEQYEAVAHLRAAPNADGVAYISLMQPATGDDRWDTSSAVNLAVLSEANPDTWQRLVTTTSILDGRDELNFLLELHNNHDGYVAWDLITVTRTRGNRDRMDSVAYPVVPGESYRLTAYVKSGGSQQIGSVRIGLTLTGSSDPEVIDTDQGHTRGEWTKVTLDFSPSDGQTAATPFVMGEDIIGDPIWVDDMALEKVADNRLETVHLPFAVTPEQTYEIAADVRSDANVTRGTVTVGVRYYGVGLPDAIGDEVSADYTQNEWVHISTPSSPPEGYTVAIPFVRFTDVEGGFFYCDKITFIQVDNNRDSVTGTSFYVTPERNYRMVAAVQSTAGAEGGDVTLSVDLTGTARIPLNIPSSVMGVTDGDWKLLVFDFTPPSGYDVATPRITGTDIVGVPFWVDEVTCRDTDESTWVRDVQATATSVVTLDTTVPIGAERVGVALVAEALGLGWLAENVSLIRTGVTPATSASVVQALLADPETGAALTVVPGVIVGPEVIPYDWEARNQHPRGAFTQFSQVVAFPSREWRTNPDNTLDWDTAEGLFTDHVPGTEDEVLFVEGDLNVRGFPRLATSAERVLTDVKVIGAERPAAAGPATLVTGSAHVDSTIRDWHGRPLKRNRLVQDSTVDHKAYADAKADVTLSQNNHPARSVTVALNTERVLPDLGVGEWVYAYKPAAGLRDPSYEARTSTGRVVQPMRLRILTMERVLGPEYHMVLRLPGGNLIPLTGLKSADRTTITLTLGDRRPEFAVESGRNAGREFMRRVAQGPR